MNEKLRQTAALLVAKLKNAGMTIATAESCTGGLVSEAITSVPGASGVFGLGLCVYSEEMKIKVLGVAPEIITEHGAVSAETALSMVENVKRLAVSDCAVSVTGVAGPGGGTADTPVGTVWIGWAFAGSSGTEKNIYNDNGGRDEIRSQAALRAICIIDSLINEANIL